MYHTLEVEVAVRSPWWSSFSSLRQIAGTCIYIFQTRRNVVLYRHYQAIREYTQVMGAGISLRLVVHFQNKPFL